MKSKLSAIIDSLKSPEIRISLIAFVIILVVVEFLTLVVFRDDQGLIKDILVEAHGLVFDVFVFGVIIAIYIQRLENQRDIKRYEEEIEDFRHWESEEAKFRIIGNLKRLEKRKKVQINISKCYLRGSILERLSFIKINAKNTDFTDSRFRNIKFTNGDLTNSDFSNSFLENISFKNATLVNTSFENATLKNVNFDNSILSGKVILSLQGDVGLVEHTYRINSDTGEFQEFGGAIFKNCIIENSSFLNIEKYAGVDFTGVQLKDVQIEDGLKKYIDRK